MKPIGKHPLEYFCFNVEVFGKNSAFDLAIKQQYCSFIKDTCFKFRKSTPNVKVGICTVGSSVAKGSQVMPVIICPHRFKEPVMFETIRLKYLHRWKNVKWIPEVNIGVGGSIDYVAVELNDNGLISDFLCIEIQAAGTTGSPYYWIENLRKYGKLVNPNKNFGINWANEFSKTMMQQAYKKGKIVEHWNRKIVFVFQDIALDYLRKTADCSKLESSNPSLPVDFCTFKLVPVNDIWSLKFSEIQSTTIDGINTIIGGAPVDEYPTETEFIDNIMKKGIADGLISPPHKFK